MTNSTSFKVDLFKLFSSDVTIYVDGKLVNDFAILNLNAGIKVLKAICENKENNFCYFLDDQEVEVKDGKFSARQALSINKVDVTVLVTRVPTENDFP